MRRYAADQTYPGHEMENQDQAQSIITDVAGAAISVISGVSLPAPVRRNALKAFDQLCAAVVDIPVAYLEGFAQAKRAENAARAELIKRSGDQISLAIEVDPAYARAAASKFAQKIVRERQSLDQVSAIAAAKLEQASENASESNGAEISEISEDWINSFENEAAQKSSAEMQEMFGSILAGEIQRPGSFSVRTVKILGQMDATSAALFQKICSMAISLQLNGQFFDSRVASLGGNAASNGLAKYGLSFDSLNTLQEYGLVISDFNSYMDYRPAIATSNKVAIGFTHAGALHALVPKEERSASAEFRVHGVMLTKAGRELLRVVPVLPEPAYTADLVTFFEAQGFRVVPVGATAA
jgi:hypothetical protein